MNSNEPTISDAESKSTTASALPAAPPVVLPASACPHARRGTLATLALVFGGAAAVMFLVVALSGFAFLFLGVNVRHAAAHAAATAVEEQSQGSVPSPAPAPR